MVEDYLSDNREELKEYELQSAIKIIQKKQISSEIQEIKEYLIKKGYGNSIIKEAFEDVGE